jgi:hypothetical protein
MLGAAWPAAIPEDRFMALLARAPVFRNADCAGAVMPDLRSLRRSLRNVTLYDEAGPEIGHPLYEVVPFVGGCGTRWHCGRRHVLLRFAEALSETGGVLKQVVKGMPSVDSCGPELVFS